LICPHKNSASQVDVGLTLCSTRGSQFDATLTPRESRSSQVDIDLTPRTSSAAQTDIDLTPRSTRGSQVDATLTPHESRSSQVDIDLTPRASSSAQTDAACDLFCNFRLAQTERHCASRVEQSVQTTATHTNMKAGTHISDQEEEDALWGGLQQDTANSQFEFCEHLNPNIHREKIAGARGTSRSKLVNFTSPASSIAITSARTRAVQNQEQQDDLATLQSSEEGGRVGAEEGVKLGILRPAKKVGSASVIGAIDEKLGAYHTMLYNIDHRVGGLMCPYFTHTHTCVYKPIHTYIRTYTHAYTRQTYQNTVLTCMRTHIYAYVI